MLIGEFAKLAGVNQETIRFYERSGYLPAPERLPSNYRCYRREDANIVRFLHDAQTLGFPIKDALTLAQFALTGSVCCQKDNSEKLRLQEQIDQKIHDLQVLRNALLHSHPVNWIEAKNRCSLHPNGEKK